MQSYSAVPTTPAEDAPAKPWAKEPESDVYFAETFVDDVAGWPPDPQTLAEAVPTWASRVLPHVLLLLIPFAAIGLSSAMWLYDGKAESHGGKLVRQAMSVTATLWPILFAAVLGQTLRVIALFRAERGIRFGILELLASSRTLTNTLYACFSFRMLSIWPPLLLLVWTLSPIGGQSALRAMELQQQVTTSELRLSSYPTNNLSVYETSLFQGPPSYDSFYSVIQRFRMIGGTVFTTQDINLLHANGSSKEFDLAIQRAGGTQEAVKISKRDIWRNVRVPFIHRLPGYSLASDWVQVPSDQIVDHSSLIGMPIRGFPSTESANTTFRVPSNYLIVDVSIAVTKILSLVNWSQCSPWINETTWLKSVNTKIDTVGYFKSTDTIMTKSNIRFGSHVAIERSASVARKGARFDKRRVVLATPVNVTLCEVSTEYVESVVHCSRVSKESDLSCSVIRMRRMPEIDSNRNFTALDIGHITMIMAEIPLITASLHSDQNSVLERWLIDPPTALHFNADGSRVVRGDLEKVPLQILSNRLALVLNTHLQAALNHSVLVGNGDMSPNHVADASWANTTGTWTEFNGVVYHVNRTWSLLYLVAAAVLLVCAVVNLVLRWWIIAPDLFGSVGGLTRDSIFFVLPTPASTMAASDRSVLLKDEWVMIQDTMPDKQVGRIAFSNAKSLVPLRQGRKYC